MALYTRTRTAHTEIYSLSSYYFLHTYYMYKDTQTHTLCTLNFINIHGKAARVFMLVYIVSIL